MCRSSSNPIVLPVLIALAAGGVAIADDHVRFGRDVLPILSDRCFHCHGPDEANREADLRLDVREDAVADRGGHAAITAGKPERSELLARITSKDADVRMPPPDAHRKPLSPREIATLRTWIAEGAEWGRHWAFVRPTRPTTPLGGHPIDDFVRRRLDEEGLKLSPQAAKRTLIRRLSFDLTGLPPTEEQIERFLEDDSPEAWERLVDRYLESPFFGERMAMWWLDAARYSDTDGFQQDAERTNWAWRDWVVESFNENEPFDEFTIEQFAGDLLPNATPEQRIATCFHRNHMTNGEGGRDPEESRIDYVIDRVNTTGTVWLGLTLGCAQCHTHKFDPVTHADYYRMFAFFNGIAEDGRAGRGAKPYLPYKSPLAARSVDEMKAHVDELTPLVATARRNAEAAFADWLVQTRQTLSSDHTAWHPMTPTRITSAEGTTFRIAEDEPGIVQATGPSPRQDDYRIRFAPPPGRRRITGWRLEVQPHESHTDGKLSRGESGEFILTNVKLLVHRVGDPQVRDVEMSGAVADAEKSAKGRAYGKVKDTLDDDPRNGWTTEGTEATRPHEAVFALDEPLEVREDEELEIVLLHRSTKGDANIGRFRISVTDEVGETVRRIDGSPLESLAGLNPEDEVPTELRKRLLDQFLLDSPAYSEVRGRLDEANRQLAEVRRAAGKLGVMVLEERAEPRETHVLVRGVWDAKGDVVEPNVLAAVLPWDGDEAPRSRVDLARWLVSAENPLTPRVVVNHLWQLVFGAGLVRTPSDFGLQGEHPTHPELLDWLAVELVESGWDVKHVLRLIVTSETYRQRSVVTKELLERDPENRLLGRSPRHRRPAWMIRDGALRAAGLLNPALGGPPIRPYQPKGVWQEIFMGRFTYRPSVGPAQYRRTLYAFWRRSSAPTFLFDNAQRRVCEVQTRLTNTPLHALTLLNDETVLEASRTLADRVLERPEGDDERVEHVFRRVLGREPSSDETAVLLARLSNAHTYYVAHPDDAVTFATVGQRDRPARDDAPAIAAWTTVAALLFNLDEAITRE